MVCATCRRTLPEDSMICGGCGTPTVWNDKGSTETFGETTIVAPPAAVRPRPETHEPAVPAAPDPEFEATVVAPAQPVPAESPGPPLDATLVARPAPAPASAEADSPTPVSAPPPEAAIAPGSRSLARRAIAVAILIVAAAALAVIFGPRRERVPAPPRAEAATSRKIPDPPDPLPSPPEPPAVASTATESSPPLGDGWLGLVEQSSGRALVLEPLMRRVDGSWRRDWPDPVADDGAQSATSLVLRVRNGGLLRPDVLPQDWLIWDARGIEHAVAVSGPTTVTLSCMRGAGLKTDLPLPGDPAAFHDLGEGEIMLVDPLVAVSGLAQPVPAETAAPGSRLEALAWSVLADLDQLETAGVERWAAEAGAGDGRVQGTGIALDAAIRAASGPWKLTVQVARSPIAGAVPLLFTATRTHPQAVPDRVVDCPSIVIASGWALVRGARIERLDATVQVERGDCERGPPTPRLLAFLGDAERRLALALELGYERVDVVLIDVGPDGAKRVLVLPHGGC